MKKYSLYLLKKLSMLALGIAVLSVNTASLWFICQPQEPKALQKYKRVK